MILRLYVDNFASFADPTEFNTFPNLNLDKHRDHIYSVNGISLLKVLTIYGANASGKSNLIKALSYLQKLVLEEEIPSVNYKEKFALSKENRSKSFKIAVEFLSEDIGYIYGVEINKNEIVTEELYISGLGEKDDELLFKKSIDNGKAKLSFYEEFYNVEKNVILLDVLEESLLKKDKPVLKFLTTLSFDRLQEFTKALYWFENTMRIIRPRQSISGLAYNLSIDSELFQFANEIMKAYHVGIKEIVLERHSIEEFFGIDDTSTISEIKNTFERVDENVLTLSAQNGNDEICIIEEDDGLKVLQIRIKHICESDEDIELFGLDDESDGTRRLLDFIPAFYIALKYPAVFCVDEIGQSIHPILIKELLDKFSNDKNTKGQIIFTTHESNLLDQRIFRRDEIWFAEKEKKGSTRIYSLNSFKEHNTKNIRKGYLNGRYGAIPFLGNLQDLNWLEYDIA